MNDAEMTPAAWQEIVTKAGEKERVLYQLPGYKLTEDGLVAENPTHAEAIATGRILGKFQRLTIFAIGEWARDVQARFQMTHAQIVKETGITYDTLTKGLWLSNRFPPDQRVEGVPDSTHEAAAPLPPQQARVVLERARDEGLKRHEIRAIVKAARGPEGEVALTSTVVSVSTADVRGAAWSLALAFGPRLDELVDALIVLQGQKGTRE